MSNKTLQHEENRWYIQKSGVGWSFYTYDNDNIQIKRFVRQANKRIWDEKPGFAKYANGYYPTLQARNFWDEKIAEGYSKTEMFT